MGPVAFRPLQGWCDSMKTDKTCGCVPRSSVSLAVEVEDGETKSREVVKARLTLALNGRSRHATLRGESSRMKARRSRCLFPEAQFLILVCMAAV